MQLQKDFIQSFLFEQSDVRGRIVRLENSIRTIMDQHDYPVFIRSILGQLLVASTLLASTLKFEGQLTLQFQGEGSLKMLVAKCSHDFNIRGLAKWDENAEKNQLKQDFFSGQLVITLEEFRENKRHQSIVDINHKTIAEAIEIYFLQSEQIPTKIILANNKHYFAGLLLQKMPSHNTEQINFWEHVGILAGTLKEEEFLKWDNQRLLKNLFHEENIHLYNPILIHFYCPCSKEKMENAVRMLGKKEALSTFSTQKILTVTCDYCNASYEFTSQAVEQLFH